MKKKFITVFAVLHEDKLSIKGESLVLNLKENVVVGTGAEMFLAFDTGNNRRVIQQRVDCAFGAVMNKVDDLLSEYCRG